MQADNKEEEEEIDEHDMVLAGLQYSLLAAREEAAEGAAEAAEEAAAATAAAEETIKRLEQVCFHCVKLKRPMTSHILASQLSNPIQQ